MFKDDYKKELDKNVLSDNFKNDTIALMEKHSLLVKAKPDNRTLPFKRWVGIVAVFAFSAVTIYSSGVLLAKKESKNAPMEFAQRIGDGSARISDNGKADVYSEDFCHFVDMVVVDGTNYWRTGVVNNDARCGMMDGYITSSVESGNLATENNQSNFGTGYGYQYGREGTIEVNIDGEWVVFSTMEEEE